jgi:hypothetical protein
LSSSISLSKKCLIDSQRNLLTISLWHFGNPLRGMSNFSRIERSVLVAGLKRFRDRSITELGSWIDSSILS